MRLKIIYSYHGGHFCGSAPQSNQTGVIDALNQALKSMGILTIATGSSRTDKGVHALRQVAHIDVPSFWHNRLDTLRQYLNNKMQYIFILAFEVVLDNFHSRFDATYRHYRYCISPQPNPLYQDLCSVAHIKDFARIQTHIKDFEGEHDFAGFQKTGTLTHSTTRQMFQCRAYHHYGFFILSFKARGFLRSQVRLMSAALVYLANGQISLEQFNEQLHHQVKHCTKSMSPQGLYLVRVGY